jgi:hypothetical protein
MEIDNMIFYEDYIILLESKSGSLTESGLIGGLIRFKDDVKGIVKKGDAQMNAAIDYIQSSQSPIFYYANKKEALRITIPTNRIKFIKIVITYVPFRGLIFGTDEVKYLDLSNKNKCLIISIFDFELIAKFLFTPSIRKIILGWAQLCNKAEKVLN